MKYLRIFDSVSDMNTAIASSEIGILGLAYDNGTPVMKIKPTPPPPAPIPFYVENITNEAETLTIAAYDNTYYLEIPVEQSTDGTTWSSLGTTGETPLTRVLQPGDKVYLRATTDTWCERQDDIIHNCGIFGVSKVGGNIMSLLYGSNFTGRETTFPSGSMMNFYGLFIDSSNDSLVNSYLVSASELILPATALSPQCYANMFFLCNILTAAPELPATTLAPSCYASMFNGCGDINYIKCLATDISASNCVSSWTNGVATTGTFVKNPNMSSWESGASGIPSGWTVEDATV